MVQAEDYLDTLGVHVEACSNEASAAAMLGASIHYPLRGAVTWKSIVGTNVAADALSNLVFARRDRRRAQSSSAKIMARVPASSRKRTHAYALKSSMLMLDPRPELGNMVRMVEEGFRLSEASNMPALMELRIRACHVRGSFVCKGQYRAGHLDPAPHGRAGEIRLLAALRIRRSRSATKSSRSNRAFPRARRHIADRRLNEFFAGRRDDVGIIVQGGLYNSLIRALQQFGAGRLLR